MSLKNIRLKTPEYEDIVPSTGESVKYRPFTVAEEKLLLIASESSDNKQIAENDIGIELDKVKISKTEGHTNSIKLDDNLVFVMKDPQLEVLSMYDENKNSVDNIVEIICNSIKNVQLDDEIIEVSSADITDAKNLVEQLTSDQFKMLSAFFDTMPKTSIDIEYECIKCSEINKKNLEGMHNFF